jgi:23S rRNA (cytidine1920-2'-O)/16S rRNA (cytidine1409-2'-O)-methyltransferase
VFIVMKMASKQRLDQILVDRGLVESRSKAQALIVARQVRVDGQLADKPGRAYDATSNFEVLEKLRYVSRGGLKLEGALQNFQIDPNGCICADLGSSTGGFTDCLLQHGASHVFAFDVGHGQLDWRLRNDARVTVRESINVRYLEPSDLPNPVDLLVGDLSFISWRTVFPVVPGLLHATGKIVLLIKPQFEVGRDDVGKGGIVKNPVLHQQVCEQIAKIVSDSGFDVKLMDSPILGAEGNREFLLFGQRKA